MAEAAAEQRRAAHLPEQPRQAFGAFADVARDERAKLFGQVEQYRARLEHPDRRAWASIEQGRDLGVGVDADEAAAELIALHDLDQMRVVFGAGKSPCQ